MKKTVSWMLAIAMLFALCACGVPAPAAEPTPAEPSIGDQMYEKYGSIIDNLEAGEYEKVIEEVSAMMPKPVETIVTITPENFYDYYEICYREPRVEKDAQGNIVEYQAYSTTYDFRLKEDYKSRLVSDRSNVEIGLTCEYDLYHVDSIDWSNGSIQLSEDNYNYLKNEFREETSASSTQSGNIRIDGANAYIAQYSFWHKNGWGWTNGEHKVTPDYVEDYYMFLPVDITIVRAEGTLVFQE